MPEQIITTTGLKSSRRAAKKPLTRLIRFPDGVMRHITLPAWQWAGLDSFARPGSFMTPHEIVSLAFESARTDSQREHMSFEEKLRFHFSLCLGVAASYSSDHWQGRANDA